MENLAENVGELSSVSLLAEVQLEDGEAHTHKVYSAGVAVSAEPITTGKTQRLGCGVGSIRLGSPAVRLSVRSTQMHSGNLSRNFAKESKPWFILSLV